MCFPKPWGEGFARSALPSSPASLSQAPQSVSPKLPRQSLSSSPVSPPKPGGSEIRSCEASEERRQEGSRRLETLSPRRLEGREEGHHTLRIEEDLVCLWREEDQEQGENVFRALRTQVRPQLRLPMPQLRLPMQAVARGQVRPQSRRARRVPFACFGTRGMRRAYGERLDEQK